MESLLSPFTPSRAYETSDFVPSALNCNNDLQVREGTAAPYEYPPLRFALAKRIGAERDKYIIRDDFSRAAHNRARFERAVVAIMHRDFANHPARASRLIDGAKAPGQEMLER